MTQSESFILSVWNPQTLSEPKCLVSVNEEVLMSAHGSLLSQVFHLSADLFSLEHQVEYTLSMVDAGEKCSGPALMALGSVVADKVGRGTLQRSDTVEDPSTMPDNYPIANYKLVSDRG